MVYSRYLLKRLIYALMVLFIIITFNFIIFRLIPGDATKMIIDPKFTSEAKAELKREFGLHEPTHVQYIKYVGNMIKFDLGISFSTGRFVINELKERLPNTMVLFLTSFVLTVVIGISIGVYTASKQGTFSDGFVTGAGLFTYAVPTFWIQLLLLMLFGYYIPILPVHGTISAPQPYGLFLQILDRVHHLILPAGSNVIVGFGSWALYTRNTMLEALDQDYIVTAKAKGLKENIILRHHALRSVLPPIITLVFGALPGVVSGAVITETIFSWHGVGKYLTDAIMMQDYPAAQGAFYLIALAVVVCNFAADIIYGFVDPRIRIGEGGKE